VYGVHKRVVREEGLLSRDSTLKYTSELCRKNYQRLNFVINDGHDSACMGLFVADDGVKSFMTGLHKANQHMTRKAARRQDDVG
jgi:hypothetical protein